MGGTEVRPVEVPKELETALRRASLWNAFASLSASHRREHAQYVAEAKRPETRARRAERCVGMLEADQTSTDPKPIIVRID